MDVNTVRYRRNIGLSCRNSLHQFFSGSKNKYDSLSQGEKAIWYLRNARPCILSNI